MHHMTHKGTIFQAASTWEHPWSSFQHAKRSTTLKGITQAKPILQKCHPTKPLPPHNAREDDPWISHSFYTTHQSITIILRFLKLSNVKSFPREAVQIDKSNFGRHMRCPNTLPRKRRTILRSQQLKVWTNSEILHPLGDAWKMRWDEKSVNSNEIVCE